MKGPESRKKFLKTITISVTVKIHPYAHLDQRENFKWGPWGAVYVTSQGDSTLNILRKAIVSAIRIDHKKNKENGFSEVF